MACIKLILSAICSCCCCRPGKDNTTAPRDLELGDLEREHCRDSDSGSSPRRERSLTRRDRGIPHPDAFDVYGNHWDKTSLDSLVRTRSIRVTTPDAANSWDVEDDDARDEDVLLHPDVFDIVGLDGATTLAGTTAENTPEAGSSVDLGSVPLRVISTLDLDYYEEDDDTGESRATTITTRDFAAAESGSKIPSSSSLPSFSESLPSWLTTPKATAHITGSRFVEGDVDGPDIAPPDFGLIVEQQEMLERRQLSVRTRGNTWHAGQEEREEASGRAGSRRSV